MPLVKAKICGLKEKNEIITCIKYGAAFCGFILNYPKSHRYIDLNKLNEFRKVKKFDCKFVGVLVNPTVNEIKKFNHPIIDYFQLHGEENIELIKTIKLLTKKKIIKTIKISNEKDLKIYNYYEKIVDIFLFDSAGFEKSQSFDHTLLNKINKKDSKWMVAGNIKIDDLDNFPKIADYIDVSGSLETNKKKDIKKIKEFLLKVKKLNYEN